MGRALESGMGAASEPSGARCVVLHAPPDARHPAPVPVELEESLDRRGVRRVLVTNGFAALAEVCASDPRTGTRPPSALLIVEPRLSAPRDLLARLVAAVRRHAPEVSVWRYERHANPPLRAIEADPQPAQAADATPARRMPEVVVRKGVAPPSAARGMTLRIAPDSVHTADAAPGAAAPSAPAATPLLSDEELAMLLADDPGPRPRQADRPESAGETP